MPDAMDHARPTDPRRVLRSQRFRVSSGAQIDRSRTLNFRFDGKAYTGHPGDTLASALLANGVRLVGRSFKYHRPRGILSAGSEEPNALVELRTGARREPNTRATVVELYDGLAATSQNRWPSLGFDVLAVNSLLSPFLSAGFYYKTFMWPASFWEKIYEPAIRRAAGLGALSGEHDPDQYEKAYAFCDVLVIGGGPAGLMAARAAAASGARVILCDEDFALGGRALAEDRSIGGVPAHLWAARMEDALHEYPDLRVMRRTTVFGVYDGGRYGALERVGDHLPEPLPHQPRQRLWTIVAKQSVLAAGAIERPLVFDGNDRPGVMLAGSVRSYVNRFGVAPAKRAVVFANNDDAVRTVADLSNAGVVVEALVDPRADVPESVRAIAARHGAHVFAGAAVRRAHGSKGVHAVEIFDGRHHTVVCDLLAMSGGWNPTLHLSTYLGGKPRWDDTLAAFTPGENLPQGMQVAGAAAGVFGLEAGLASGARAGAAAAAACGFKPERTEAPRVGDADLPGSRPFWRVRGGGKAFVDFQNDVTAKDVTLAHKEGFRAVEHLKRYTTLGMATDQGKTANVNGLALMAELTSRSIPETGTTGFRPPFTPVPIGALAGHHRGKSFRPTRLTPTHRWAERQGAVFVETGQWLRAQYFPRTGESDWLATVIREVNAVRSSVGFCDVTTLGKIDIQGADAAAFLDRVCVNGWSKLGVGRVRYSLMLREDGFILDDGTASRLAPDHFVATASTAHAGQVFQHLEFCHQCLWPELDVQLISVTEQWAELALAGPNARKVLRKIVDPQFDVSKEAFSHLACAEVTVCGGTRARLFGVSFSGELAYEIAVPARFGNALAQALMQAGAEFNITPYGTEALGVMRVEKGYPSGGELNGQVTAHDIGMQKLMSKTKDYVGRALALRPALTDPARPTLIGLKPVEPGARLRAGAHLLPKGAASVAANDQGYTTSAVYSPTLGHWIALGYLSNGPARLGEVVVAHDPVRGPDVLVEVVSPVFLDPKGERANA